MLRFSLLQIMKSVCLIGFVLATAQGEKYSVAAMLQAACVGMLIYGIGWQAIDLWKARAEWNEATRDVRNGWRLAIGIRVLIAVGLFAFAVLQTPKDLAKFDEPTREWLGRLISLWRQVGSLLLICGLALGPWYWRQRESGGRASVVMQMLAWIASAMMLLFAWVEFSTIVALIHMAIEGVSLSQSLWKNAQSQVQSPVDAKVIRLAASVSYAALAMSAIAVLMMIAPRKSSWVRLNVTRHVLGLLALAGSTAAIGLLHFYFLPRVSPLLVEASVYTNPAIVATIVCSCGFVGFLIAMWRQGGGKSDVARPWRSSIYVHETRFFFEVLVFALVLGSFEFYHGLSDDLMRLFSAMVGQGLMSSSSLYQLFWYRLTLLIRGPLDCAIWFLAFQGLLCCRKAAATAIDQTPAPVNARWFVIDVVVFGLIAYCVGESALWSNFFFWITSG